MSGDIKWEPNPFDLMIEAAQEIKPIKAKIRVSSLDENEQHWWGRTLFVDDSDLALIEINKDCTLEAALEVLAHELAHVIAGPEADHGPRFKETFDQIYDLWTNKMEPFYKRGPLYTLK